jgi:predicted membrane GTPase involved in stress response
MDSYGYFHLPVEQLVRCTHERLRPRFVAEAKELFPDNDDYLVAGSPAGLLVLAQNELALEEPVAILREVYGSRIAVQAPRARRIGGARPQEPVMQLRVSLPRRHAEAVKEALATRGAMPAGEYSSANHCVLRYEAPLARLLGLPTELARLTGGRARHWTALSHYAEEEKCLPN